MNDQKAKIFTREELTKALQETIKMVMETTGQHPIPGLADYMYDHYGIETDISDLKEN